MLMMLIYLAEVLHTVQENTGSLEAASKDFGLEVNADKTKYMIMSRNQNAGPSHNVKIGYISVERVEEFKYLGKTLTKQSSLRKEIKSRLKSGNACCHSMQNLLSSSLLSKNTKIDIYTEL
jgi:hypothetical protein